MKSYAVYIVHTALMNSYKLSMDEYVRKLIELTSYGSEMYLLATGQTTAAGRESYIPKGFAATYNMVVLKLVPIQGIQSRCELDDDQSCPVFPALVHVMYSLRDTETCLCGRLESLVYCALLFTSTASPRSNFSTSRFVKIIIFYRNVKLHW